MERNNIPNQCLSLNEIKGFLNKNISEEERATFTNHFASCKLCKEVKDSFATVNQLGVEEDIASLKEAIFFSTNRRINTNRRQFLSRIAAGILLPIAGTAAFFYWNSTDNERLYDEYYQPYLLPDETKRSTDGINQYDNINLPKDLELAIENYKSGKFKESLPHFKAYQKIQPKNTFANFLFGLANLEENNIESAIKALESVREENTNLKTDAIWYLALANLKKKNKAKATQLLDEIINTKNKFYRPKAAALKNSYSRQSDKFDGLMA